MLASVTGGVVSGQPHARSNNWGAASPRRARAGADGWQIRACAGVEAALAGAALAPHTLVAALEALPADTRPAPEAAEFIDAVAQGILLEALAPLVQQARARPGLPRARRRLAGAQLRGGLEALADGSEWESAHVLTIPVFLLKQGLQSTSRCPT